MRRGGRSHQPGLAAVASAFPARRWLETPRIVLIAAGAMFVAVFGLRQLSSDSTAGIAFLYTVPIALIALELGLRAGIAAAGWALALVGVWEIGAHVDLDVAAVAALTVAFLAIGATAGRFGDRMRDAQRRQLLLLESGLSLAHLDAVEDLPEALASQAQALVSSRSARVELVDGPAAEVGSPIDGGADDVLPIEVRGVRYGTLEVSGLRPMTVEDHSMLAILALQAAVAAENRRLLASERERAMIRNELQNALVHLDERGRQLRELMHRQEEERYHLAYELNEQAAQSLAAVLLGLAVLERELGSGSASPRLGTLRADVDSTLRSLRSLAISLRPPVLMLGLQAALERLAEHARSAGVGEMTVALREAGSVSGEGQTMVYRVVEEALDAVGAARRVSVSTRPDGGELVIDVEDADRPIALQRLAVLQARMELIGGRLSAGPTELHVVIPLPVGETTALVP